MGDITSCMARKILGIRHRTQRKNAEFILAAGEKGAVGVSGKDFWRVGHLSMKFSKNKLELRV